MVLATVPFCAVPRMTSFAPKYPPEMVKRSHWPLLPPKHVENSLSSQLSRACCKLQQHLSYRWLWFITSRGQQVSQSSQVLTAIKLISLGRSSLAKIQLLKEVLSCWHDPKPKALKSLKNLTEVQRRKGRTLAPEQIRELSACKYLQNSTHPSETLCTSEAAGRQQWKQNTHCSDFKISTSNSFLQWIRSVSEGLLSYQRLKSGKCCYWKASEICILTMETCSDWRSRGALGTYWQSCSPCWSCHPVHVQGWPEQADFAIHSSVSLHPFKQLPSQKRREKKSSSNGDMLPRDDLCKFWK